MIGKEVTATFVVLAGLVFCSTDTSAATARSTSEATQEQEVIASRAVEYRERLTLRYVGVRRDRVVPTMATLLFELTPERGAPVSALNPSLELLEGLSELWPVKSTFKTEWRKSRFDERKWIVKLRVYATKPGVKELRYVSVRLHYKGRPRGGDFRTAEFRFDKIPMP